MKIIYAILALLASVLVGILPPCPTEDSENCVWNAQAQGNEQGGSFVNILGWVVPIGGQK